MIKTERSALIVDSDNTIPKYAFENSIAQRKKRQLRQFQICLSTIICFGVIILLVTTTISLTSMRTNFTTLNNEMDEVIATNLLTLPGVLMCNDSHEKYYNTTYFEEVINTVGDDLEKLWKLEKTMPKLNINSPSYKHQMTVATSNRSNELALLGLQEELAAKKYLQNKNDKIVCADNIVNGNSLCRKFKNISCKKYAKYRSFNGVCNNLLHPFDYGVAYIPFRRILPPNYSDGINKPRLSKDGEELPSARTISTIIHRPYSRNDPNFTVMLAVFGQFLDHDITSTASSRNKDGSVISCCGNTLKHPECFPVKISNEDPYYSFQNVTCMNFIRSAPAPNCCLSSREQMSQVSAYIDASVVYGSSLNAAKNLRILKKGFLKMYTTTDSRQLLPLSNDSRDGCNREEQNRLGRYCFASGDARANENLHLTTMHLIWARHHNNLANHLGTINLHWDDERVFQEARKILIAQMQHITYNEFLKIIIGKKQMKEFDLLPKQKGYFHGYDTNLDSTIANSFASASFRFAHSLIPTLVHFINSDTDSVDYVKLHHILFDPYLLYKDGELDKIIKGAIHAEVQANDAFFTPELKEHLFETNDENIDGPRICGLDLVSLNIQRGRDHGLQGYVYWRELCKLSRPKSFDDLSHDIDAETLNYIKNTYRNVEDIDLYTGSLSEKSIKGSMLGPTLNCLITDQFIRLKKGDRYWYENPDIFTPGQLEEIRKTTLASILCDNSDKITEIQQSVMERKGNKNFDIPCTSLQKTNLEEWNEKYFPHVYVGNRDMAIGYKTTYGTADTALNG